MLELITLPIDDAIAQARATGARQTRALVRTPEARVMLVGMASGSEWPEHKAAGRVVVRVERGRVEFLIDGTTHALHAGELATVEPGETHTVRALEDAALLVIVAGPAMSAR